ncbi:toll-like receptor 3 [Topomyia yanbarensis]|uniref:toll-like receptor 3 n=1 Tax=Topomyia yanbarensis TaxID=2498891 RepID=UPI00273BBC29|nr:toll-like receptor 3 [Topomyia yanbarensis]
MFQKSIWLLLIVISSSNGEHEYQCIEFPVENQCLLEQIVYHPGEQIVFPDGFKHFRIYMSKYKYGLVSNISAFDEQLYEAMHRPAGVELSNVYLQRLVLPSNLQYGTFSHNELRTIEIDRSKIYRISFLDLDSNHISNIKSISALINLETLHLQHNSIKTIDKSTFAPLVKLKRLYLMYNNFRKLPWDGLPASLVHLDCRGTGLVSVDFSRSNLPALEYLNVAKTRILVLDVTDLLRAAPNLRKAYLFNHQIPSDEMGEIVKVLNQHNITNYDIKEEYCYYDEEYIDGRCVRPTQPYVGISTWMAVLLTVVTLVVGALFIYLVYLVFTHIAR